MKAEDKVITGCCNLAHELKVTDDQKTVHKLEWIRQIT